MSDYVAFDLDSTLADTRHRWVEAPKAGSTKTWRDYAMACEGDVPMAGVVGLALLLQASFPLRIMSWRHRDALWLTEKWLTVQGIRPHRIHLLGTNAEIKPGDSHAGGKVTLVEQLRLQGHDCKLFVDDYPELAPAMAAIGVPALIVNPMYRDDPMAYSVAQAAASGVG